MTIELPQHHLQTAFNLQRWAEVLADPKLREVEGRIETDRHGHITMSPPPAPGHGGFQARIASLLDRHMTTGRVYTECPISTADGVKAADVAWASPDLCRRVAESVCFPQAPEICVEVVSPGNTQAEIAEKRMLYFDAGAKEVWLCSKQGAMTFFRAGHDLALPASELCPNFPGQVSLR